MAEQKFSKDPVIYNRLRNNFTQVSNSALLNTKLSAKAYKLYAYMCYRIGISESWEFNKEEILKHFKEGEIAMRSAFNELIKEGFLVRERVRNDKGFFIKTDYIIYAEPVNTGSNPQVQNPRVDKPRVDNPHVENAVYNNKEEINKENNNKDSFSSSSEKDELLNHHQKNKMKCDFEEFWLINESRGWEGVKNKFAWLDRFERTFTKSQSKVSEEKKEKEKSYFKISSITEMKMAICKWFLIAPDRLEKEIGVLSERDGEMTLKTNKNFSEDQLRVFAENKITIIKG